jgi:hypothetical protein
MRDHQARGTDGAMVKVMDRDALQDHRVSQRVMLG